MRPAARGFLESPAAWTAQGIRALAPPPQLQSVDVAIKAFVDLNQLRPDILDVEPRVGILYAVAHVALLQARCLQTPGRILGDDSGKCQAGETVAQRLIVVNTGGACDLGQRFPMSRQRLENFQITLQ